MKGPLQGVPFTVSDSFDTSDSGATVVARARAAGAVLLGSAAAGGEIVAAGGAWFHIGMDYGDDVRDVVGSIRSSAAANGIVALKPTYGRVPRTGHKIGHGGPYDSFLQTAVMARRAEDLALLVEVLSGPDASDAAMIPVPLGDPGAVDIGSLRIACYTSVGATEPTAEVRSVLDQCAGYFAEAGCRIAFDQPPGIEALAAVRHRYINAAAEQIPIAEFMRCREDLDAIKSEQLAWFEQYDLILCPVSANHTSEYNTTGWPVGAARAGGSRDEAGLPLGVQVVAQPWRDDVVIAALIHIERKTGGWRAPALQSVGTSV